LAKPDVWIPETSLWLLRAQQQGVWSIPVAGPSIASSPIVLGLSESAARSLGWPQEVPTWARVFGGDMALGFVDPAVDPAGLSALIGTGQLTRASPDPGGAYALMLRKLTKNTVQTSAELFGRQLDGVVTPELELRKHNLVGVYADPAVPSLDFPYVVLPGADQAKRDAAQQLLGRLLDRSAAQALAGQ
ncbi:substrate-binding domain-containing protein, partial [Kibdelosporangium lantanae]